MVTVTDPTAKDRGFLPTFMRITYDQNCDAIFIDLQPGRLAAERPRIEKISDDIVIHRDAAGAPCSIQISNAARNVHEPGTIDFRKFITL
jgi:uncharacterized protein YuzE